MKEKGEFYNFYIAIPDFLPDLDLLPGERKDSFKESLNELESFNFLKKDLMIQAELFDLK